MDVVGQIMAFEEGELDAQQTLELFVELMNSGTINHLQGIYGRTAMSFLMRGFITQDSLGYKINQDKLPKG